jgi:uncharacterized Zn finger protein (UPF0148 family)
LKEGHLWCAKCEKRVIIMKYGEDPAKIIASQILSNLETTILEKIQEIQESMENEKDSEELEKLGGALSKLLENLEKIKKR